MTGEPKRVVVEKKLRAKVSDAVADSLMGMDKAELQERLTSLAKHESDTEVAQETDTRLNQLKADLAQLRAPYRETMQGIKLQRSFIALLLEERGS